MTSVRYESFDDFMHDLDESGRLSDDPFGIDSDIGSLDDEDLEWLKQPQGKPSSKTRKKT